MPNTKPPASDSDRIAQLEAQLADLNIRFDHLANTRQHPSASSTDPLATTVLDEPSINRRRMLTGAAIAAVATTTASIAMSGSAAAASPVVADATSQTPAVSATTDTNQSGLFAVANGTGHALTAIAHGAGTSFVSTTTAVANKVPNAIFSHAGRGNGVTIGITNPSSTAYALLATTKGTGSAIGVSASTTGRGIKIRSDVAHIWFFPSELATHPTSGSVGDLFVDSATRLWFCKGDTTWVLVV